MGWVFFNYKIVTQKFKQSWVFVKSTNVVVVEKTFPYEPAVSRSLPETVKTLAPANLTTIKEAKNFTLLLFL